MVDLPSYKMVIFHSFLYVYQRIIEDYPMDSGQIQPNPGVKSSSFCGLDIDEDEQKLRPVFSLGPSYDDPPFVPKKFVFYPFFTFTIFLGGLSKRMV